MNDERTNFLYLPTLLLLAIATSIDALAVEVSFAMLDLGIVVPIVIIGAVIFVVCFIGTEIGDKIGHLLGNKLQIAGGIIRTRIVL